MFKKQFLLQENKNKKNNASIFLCTLDILPSSQEANDYILETVAKLKVVASFSWFGC